MPLKQVTASRSIVVELLSPSNFQDFGVCIQTPSANANDLQNSPQGPLSANQGTALKYEAVSPIINLYDRAPTRLPSKLVMSLFVCTPRRLDDDAAATATATAPATAAAAATTQKPIGYFDLPIMERHPFTTQTFVPMGLDARDPTTAYLVVVAPTTVGACSTDGAGMPDLSRVRAFLARGSQAVTYSPGVWHAPMVVVGEREVSFLVTQYSNGVGGEDCEEVELGSVLDGGTVIKVAVPCLGTC